MTDKKTFLMKKEWNPMLVELTDQQLGELMRAVVMYQEGVEELPENPLLIAMFMMMRTFFAECDNSYSETCKKRAEAGAKGGEAKASKSKQMLANAKSATKNVANLADMDMDKDIDIKKEKEKKEKEKTPDQVVDESDLMDATKVAVKHWLRYKTERREAYKETGLRSLLTQVKKHETAAGSKAVCDLIDTCMASGWKGIIWDRLETRASPVKKNPFNQFQQNGYDFGDLERSLGVK